MRHKQLILHTEFLQSLAIYFAYSLLASFILQGMLPNPLGFWGSFYSSNDVAEINIWVLLTFTFSILLPLSFERETIISYYFPENIPFFTREKQYLPCVLRLCAIIYLRSFLYVCVRVLASEIIAVLKGDGLIALSSPPFYGIKLFLFVPLGLLLWIVGANLLGLYIHRHSAVVFITFALLANGALYWLPSALAKAAVQLSAYSALAVNLSKFPTEPAQNVISGETISNQGNSLALLISLACQLVILVLLMSFRLAQTDKIKKEIV